METELKINRIQNIIKYILVGLLFLGVILHITAYLYDRCMWVDEAMLTSSVCLRPFKELFSEGLDWGQSSSVGWLLLTKLTVMLFGTSQPVLRVWSVLPALGCIVMVYLTLKNTLKEKKDINFVLFFTALFALTDKYIYYGVEAKPYMLDNLVCILVLFLWQKYKNQKITLLNLTLWFSILIWFSFPGVFFIAACMIIECITHIINIFRKNEKKETVKKSVASLLKCLPVLVSFLLVYIFWLGKTSANAADAEYWELIRFPLIPTSFADIKLLFLMVWKFFDFCTFPVALVLCVLLLVYVVFCIKKKKDMSQILVPFFLSLGLLFVASALGFYPIQDRLVQPYLIVIMILCAHSCKVIYDYLNRENCPPKILSFKKETFKKSVAVVLSACILITGGMGCMNFVPSHVYFKGSEVDENIEYLSNNLKENEFVYVFNYSIPIYQYKTNFKTTYSDVEKLPIIIDNTIYGQLLITYLYKRPFKYDYVSNKKAVSEDAKLIIAHDSVYIFTSHGESGMKNLLKELKKYGKIEIANETYDTRLYHYTKTKS